MGEYDSIVQSCVKKIEATLKTSVKPLLVAVTGDSGSGKSYYSKLIRSSLDNSATDYLYLNADDFLISRKDREPMKSIFYESGEFEGKSHWEILENMFRLDDLESVLNSLKNGSATSYFPYSRETGEVSSVQVTVHPSPLILVDSSMLLNLMDIIIMVDVSRDNILKRKVERDSDIRTPAEIIEMHQKVQGYYWDRCKPSKPDIVIDNNDYSNPFIK